MTEISASEVVDRARASMQKQTRGPEITFVCVMIGLVLFCGLVGSIVFDSVQRDNDWIQNARVVRICGSGTRIYEFHGTLRLYDKTIVSAPLAQVC